MAKFVFKLYITGQSTRSEQAIANLEDLLQEQFACEYQLDVIDILQHPEVAEQERVLATPAVVRVTPLPRCQVVGDLCNREQVLSGLQLSQRRGSN